MSSSATIAIAQSPLPQPDHSGNYYRNEAPLKAASTENHLSPGSLWRVVAIGLNCRSAPGTMQPVLRQFAQGDVLQVEVYRGGSDEVLQNPTDSSGKPWMPVRGASPSDVCYVRANSRYIQPLSP
ncbi:MAG TPA: hypothetical protein V6C57_25245 [Coleofasciculaceae cyanobacterium]